jgi:hypothetical protein
MGSLTSLNPISARQYVQMVPMAKYRIILVLIVQLDAKHVLVQLSINATLASKVVQ